VTRPSARQLCLFATGFFCLIYAALLLPYSAAVMDKPALKTNGANPEVVAGPPSFL